MSLQCKGCIAPKLHGAKIKESKTMRGKERKVHNSEGKFSLKLCPAEVWSLCSLPHGVLDPSHFAPRSFGTMQHLPRKLGRLSFRDQKTHKTYLKLDTLI